MCALFLQGGAVRRTLRRYSNMKNLGCWNIGPMYECCGPRAAICGPCTSQRREAPGRMLAATRLAALGRATWRSPLRIRLGRFSRSAR